MTEPTMHWRLPEGIETPQVVIDIDAVDRNITTMSAALSARSVGLRPHTKTSKCIEVVRRQVSAGVVGLTVATLGEAEVLVEAGFTDLLCAYPIWPGHPDRARRLRQLADRCNLLVGVESVDSAEALGRTAPGLAVVIEVDSGMHRTGAAVADIATVAGAADRAGCIVRGAFTFGGHAYSSCDAPTGAADDEVAALHTASDILRSAGFDTSVLSAGSTPTATLSARPPVTDERPGTYVFQDRQQTWLGSAVPDSVALVVAANVVASHHDGRFVLDSGSKVLATDRPAWLAGFGHLPAFPDAEVRSLSEHHAVCWTTEARPSIGEVVAVVPNHACVVVNLTDELLVASLGEVVDRWRVASRGRNG